MPLLAPALLAIQTPFDMPQTPEVWRVSFIVAGVLLALVAVGVVIAVLRAPRRPPAAPAPPADPHADPLRPLRMRGFWCVIAGITCGLGGMGVVVGEFFASGPGQTSQLLGLGAFLLGLALIFAGVRLIERGNA
jgi:hypothetical protein